MSATSPPRVSAATVRRAIKRARGHHEWCWKVFVRLKSPREGDEELPQDIVHFQGRLVGAVSDLEDLSAAVRVAMVPLSVGAADGVTVVEPAEATVVAP